VAANILQIVQIVRNWGPVGGMEAYVWNLTNELAKKNCVITVICEKSHANNPSSNIQIIEIGQLKQKPRWLMYWRFANHVEKTLQSFKDKNNLIVHSHERSISHDITTFHSMPFANIREKSYWKLISIRVWAYLKMEMRELGGFKNQHVSVIPVSEVIAKALAKAYPAIKVNIKAPITPGVTPMPIRQTRLVPKNGGTIGFIGKEWKRKGLPLFIEIISQLKIKRPNLKVLILGPEKKDIEHLCQELKGTITIKGWQASANLYQELDLLIHPASSEAYGMVIAEAISCRVPVVVSDACGVASDIPKDSGSVLSLNSTLDEWVNKSELWLNKTKDILSYERPWSKVAEEYLTEYQKIDLIRQRDH
jgi:UDP-glucose:(heptosyl)LPS alpha-1,3-glucosyltransferase